MGNTISFEKLAPTCLITLSHDPEELDTSLVFRHSDVQFMSTERRHSRTEEEYRLDQEHFLRNPLQLTIPATVQSYIAGVRQRHKTNHETVRFCKWPTCKPSCFVCWFPYSATQCSKMNIPNTHWINFTGTFLPCFFLSCKANARV
jgi:hypothetical protein